MGMARILIAEADAALRIAFRLILQKRLGVSEIKEAANLAQLQSCLDQWRPDLILLDVMMPDMDGIRAIKFLKAGPFKDTKILVVAGALNDDQMNFLNNQEIPWMVKPLYKKQLVGKVKGLSEE